jgi:acetyltransferase
MQAGLAKIFNARSIAIVGASSDPSKRGNQAIRKLLVDGYDGKIYPINPKQHEILGIPAFKSVLDIEGDVDLVLVCTPAKTVPGILEQCGRKGVPGAVVLAAGFSEIGDEGAAISAATLKTARDNNVRVIGPNTNGVFNLHNNMNLVGVQDVTPGGVGVCSQSGNIMLSLVTEAKRRGGVGFSSYVGVGNQLDVTLSEYLDYFGQDENTQAALFYVEGFKDGRAFLDVCRKVTQTKPVIVFKSGRTQAGQAAAKSHTGSLASSFALTRCLLRQAGATVVEQSDKILSVAEGLSKLPPPQGGRVAILSDGGGHATVTVDALAGAGGELAMLSTATTQKLAALLPPAASCVNPVDVAGATDDNPDRMADCAEVILADDGVDILMVVGMYGGYAARFNPDLLEAEIRASHRLVDLARASGKPLVLQTVYNALRTEPIEVVKAAGVPIFIWAENAVRCVLDAIDYAHARDRIAASPTVRPGSVPPQATEILSAIRARRVLYEHEAKSLLAAYGVGAPAQFLARCEADLALVADKVGRGPMAMKIVSPDILHKSDAGGVKLNVEGIEDLRNGFRQILESAHAYDPKAEIVGVLVSPMAPPGVEVIVGVAHDPTFGPVMMFGLGGVFVEVFKDVTFRALPLSLADAREMIDEIKARPILDGARGAPPVNREALVELMLKVSQLALAHPEITEIDLNPVILRAEGYDVVDARMILSAKGH